MIVPQDSVGYRELAESLRGQILSGALAPGARMPSEKDLQQMYGCGRHTVRNAVALLREEGLIEVRHGLPTRVRVPPEREGVTLKRGAVVRAHRATEEQRDFYGSDWVIIVEYLGQTQAYGADRVTLSYG